jgi:LacI family transcriptional regulator
VTIRDVAREAGVGVATASRALGARALVKPTTRARILAAAERIGYRPSRAAKVLRGARARLIGVMIPDVSLPLYGLWLRGASDVARERDYVLLVCDGQNSIRTIEQQLDRLHQEPIDALVVAGPLLELAPIERFRDSGIPVVPEPELAKRRMRAPRSARKAGERMSGVAAAFERLVGLGHRRIVYVAQTERDRGLLSPMQALRIEHFRRTLVGAGSSWVPDERVVRVTGPDECRARLSALLAGPAPPSAIVAGTEALTPAVLAALTDEGLEVPSDVSVVGFGDSLWEQAYRPGISVVRLDYLGAGRAMMEHTIALIEGRDPVPPLPSFPAEFVERGSCAPPPARGRGRKRART